MRKYIFLTITGFFFCFVPIFVHGADAQVQPVTCTLVLNMATVAVVVDRGPGQSERVDCVTVPKNSSGTTVLSIRATQLDLPAPTYDTSGLLCSIDGYPLQGCAEAAGGGAYAYWSYWKTVNGSWAYATSGPATRKVKDGDIEGWHFIVGTGSGNDNQPTISPSLISFVTPPTPTTQVLPSVPTNVIQPSTETTLDTVVTGIETPERELPDTTVEVGSTITTVMPVNEVLPMPTIPDDVEQPTQAIEAMPLSNEDSMVLLEQSDAIENSSKPSSTRYIPFVIVLVLFLAVGGYLTWQKIASTKRSQRGLS